METLTRRVVREFARRCCDFLSDSELVRWFAEDVLRFAERSLWVPSRRTAYLVEIQSTDLFDAAQGAAVAAKYDGVCDWTEVARSILEDDALWSRNHRFCRFLTGALQIYDRHAMRYMTAEELLPIGAEIRKKFRADPATLLRHLKHDVGWNSRWVTDESFLVVFEDEGLFPALRTELF